MSRLWRSPWPFLLMLAGALVTGLHLLPSVSLPPGLILSLFLPPLLFEAAFSLRLAALRRELVWILLLGIGGALVAAGVTFVILRALGFGWEAALLLSALLAATDPVAVFAVMRAAPAPQRVRVVLQGESLANDGVAVVLFTLAAGVVSGAAPDPAGLITRFLWLSVGGLAVGAALGLALTPLLPRLSAIGDMVATAIAAYTGYRLAEMLGASGLLSVIACGLVLGNARGVIAHRSLERFWRVAGVAFAAAVFLLMGLQVPLTDVLTVLPLLPALLATVLLARVLMIVLLTRWPPGAWPGRWLGPLIWSGLRGALSLALALSIPMEVVARNEVLRLTFGFVVVSLLAQGFSIGPLFHRLKVAPPAG